MVDLHLFSAVIDLLDRLGSDAHALAKLPKQRRDELLGAITDAYKVLDAALMLVIARLGSVLMLADRGQQAEFADELGRLCYMYDWLNVEREMSLCSNLRQAGSEMQRFFSLTTTRFSVHDWSSLNEHIDRLLSGEGELAEQITRMLASLGAEQVAARSTPDGFRQAETDVRKALDELNQERRRLIKAEVTAYSYI